MKDRKYDAICAREAMVVDAQCVLQKLLNDTGMTRRDLARRMGVRRRVVKDMFSDDAKSLTLRNFAEAVFHMGGSLDLYASLEGRPAG